MKKWILSIVVCATITLPAMAQQVEGNNQLLSSGDLYQGMSRSIPNGRVVLPYGLEVDVYKRQIINRPLRLPPLLCLSSGADAPLQPYLQSIPLH